VACATGGHHGLCGGGLLHRHSCASECAPAVTVVSVYCPNYVTTQVPVTTYQTVCTPVTEKVKVTTYKMLQKPETIKVTVNKMTEVKETVKVMRCQTVEKKETVKVTHYECVPETKEESYTVYETKTTPVEMTRTVCFTAPVEQKVMATRYVAKMVEKEVAVCTPTYSSCSTCAAPASTCGSKHHGLGLFRR
jgi:hypothetical protein